MTPYTDINDIIKINTLNISNNDTIIIAFDVNECDVEECRQIMDCFHKTFPYNNIVANFFPLVKSIDIISSADMEDKKEDFVSW